jgi:hypothetical protein
LDDLCATDTVDCRPTGVNGNVLWISAQRFAGRDQENILQSGNSNFDNEPGSASQKQYLTIDDLVFRNVKEVFDGDIVGWRCAVCATCQREELRDNVI